MKIGYARVSTLDQNPDLQKDALERAGCEKVIVDKVTGTARERPGLGKVRELLRAGDTLVVWRLDRLGRSLRDLIDWVRYLEEEGVALQSLHEAIDTSTPTGKLTFHIFGALAEFERSLIQERTQARALRRRAPVAALEVAARRSPRTSGRSPWSCTGRRRCPSPKSAR